MSDPFGLGDPRLVELAKATRRERGEQAGALTAGAGGAALLRPVNSIRPSASRSYAASRIAGEHARVSDLARIATTSGRRHADQDGTDRLAHAIKTQGYDHSQPVKVLRYRDGSMVLGDGHHRVRAAQGTGMKRVPIEIKDKRGKTARISEPWLLRGRKAKAGLGKPGNPTRGATVRPAGRLAHAAGESLAAVKDFATGRSAWTAPLAAGVGGAALIGAAHRNRS